MALARRRVKSHGTAKGVLFHIPSGTETIESYDLGRSTCLDTIGNFPFPNGLEIEHMSTISLGTVSGEPPSFPVYSLSNVKTGSQDWFDHAPLSAVVPPSDTIVATQAAARTNPSRPTADLAADLLEALTDLPNLLRKQGDTVIEQYYKRGTESFAHINAHGGETGVGFRFAMAPLLRDLIQIFSFANDVDQRVKQLKKAHSQRKNRVKVNIWSESASQSVGPLTIWSLEGADVTAQIERTSVSKKWASMVWTPDLSALPPAADALVQTAREVTHGWRLSPATWWEVLPWSWLGDYFGNVGDYLKATQNTVGIHPADICIMEHTSTTSIQRILSSSSWLAVVPGISKYETKFRRLGDLGLSPYPVPFIGPNQVLNLIDIIRSRSSNVKLLP